MFCDLATAGWGRIFSDLVCGELSNILGHSSFLSVTCSFEDHKNLEKYQDFFSNFVH